MLTLAKFRALCEMERKGGLDAEGDAGGGERRVCCICRSSHLKDCFTPVEQRNGPEKRTCIGSQGILEVCPHIRVTYAGLRIKPISMTCICDHHPSSGHGRSTVSVGQVEEEGMTEAKIQTKFCLGTLERKVQKKSIAVAVQKASWSMCPHLRARDGEVCSMTLLNDSALPPITRFSAVLGTLSCWIFRTRGGPRWRTRTCVCTVPGCDTRITVFAARGVGFTTQEALFLRVERYLGELKGGADGRKWLSQIVDASSLDNKRFENDSLLSSEVSPKVKGMLVVREEDRQDEH
jgi:hypothetical protein